MAASPRDEIEPLIFGEALDFVREELLVATRDFDGPLARRLLPLSLDTPFSFLPRRAEDLAQRWGHGGLNAARADAFLALAVSRWLQEPEGSEERLLVLEDPLARRGDPWFGSHGMFHGERVYWVVRSTDDADEVTGAFKRLAGYPGIGVLAHGEVSGKELDSDDLDALAKSAVAILIRAWDDEAFLIAPVASRFSAGSLSGGS